MLYYFGSRYSSSEYLYGEEIEAWLQDGIITKAGLAFSRDTKKKVFRYSLLGFLAERCIAGLYPA